MGIAPSRKMVYLIGSLRNAEIAEFANRLEKATGYEVFCSWHAAGPEADDYWKKHEQARGRSYRQALASHAAQHVYGFDRKFIDRSEAGILLLPAGKSGHMELGFMLGTGKPGFILLDETPKLPEPWHWLAGLYEGEGTITLNGMHSVALSITSTDIDVVQRAHAIAGVGRFFGPYRPSTSNIRKPFRAKDQWRWTVSKKEDLFFVLNGLVPLLGERRKEQVRAVLEKRNFTLDGKSPAESRWDVMYLFATGVVDTFDELVAGLKRAVG